MKSLESIKGYFRDKDMDQILYNSGMELGIARYLKSPRGYAETDNMTLEQATEELEKWFWAMAYEKEADPKNYRALCKSISARMTVNWAEYKVLKDVGRIIGRYVYLTK
jgi:hypothetical protein